MRILGISLLAALFICIFPMPTNAQINLEQAGDAALSFSPQYPRPGDTITVKLRSFAADLQSADILWEVDGKTFADGMGTDSITVTAPSAGETMSIKATALANGRRFMAETSFTPAGVALLWEGVGYTPPFYKGKTLLAYGGVARVVAQPDFRSVSGARVPASELIYNWEKNGRKILSISGIGKSSAEFLQDSYIRGDESITVEVRDPATNALAKSSIVIAPNKNIISLYEESPSLGRLYNRALSGTYLLNKAELTLVAEPYFITALTRIGQGTTYRWKQDGLFSQNVSGARITIDNSVEEGKVGAFSVVVSSEKILQGGSANLAVQFMATIDSSASNNLFNDEN